MTLMWKPVWVSDMITLMWEPVGVSGHNNPNVGTCVWHNNPREPVWVSDIITLM